MKESNNPDLVRYIDEQLSLKRIKLKNSLYSVYVIGYTDEVIEIIFRQYILLKLTGTKVNATLLKYFATKKAVVLPLPDEWIGVITENGIQVSKALAKIFFFFFALKEYIAGIKNFLSYFIQNLIYQFKSRKSVKNSFSYFMYLHSDCLPSSKGPATYNIIDWYLNWDGKTKNINQINHSVKVPDFYYKDFLIRSSSHIPDIENFYKLLAFGVWGIISTFLSLLNLLIGRPQQAILLRESVERKIISLSGEYSLAKEYLFNNENVYYRPLWTYTAESRGSKITYYNWAASYGDFLGPNGYASAEIGEKIQNWPHILQWTLPYAKYLKSTLVSDSPKIHIVPPIYYCDSGSETYESDKPLISIFDVAPQREYFMDVLVPSVEYRTYMVGKQFLEDIYDIAIENGFQLLWKRKRGFSPRHHKAYVKFAEKFSKRPGIINVNPRSSAFRVIQHSYATISMPFTSTALVGESFSKPSIYYDPVKMLFKEDRGAQGIPLMSGKEELSNWIQSIKR